MALQLDPPTEKDTGGNDTLKAQLDQFATSLWATFGSSPAEGGFILSCNPGIPVNPKELDNMWSPSNPKGSKAQLQEFSQNLVGYVPDLSSGKYQHSGTLLGTVYRQLLMGANAMPPTMPAEEKKQFDEAEAWLNNTSDATSPVNQYYNAEMAVAIAQSNYNSKKNQCDLSTKAGRDKWSEEEPIYSIKLKIAKQKLIPLAAKYKYYRNIAGVGNKNGVKYAIDDAITTLNNSNLGTDKVPWYPTFAEPSDWYQTDSEGWLTYTSSEQHQLEQSAAQQTVVQGTRSEWAFIFASGDSYSSVSASSYQHDTSTNIKISAQYKRVVLSRPWFSTNWMNCNNWWTNAYNKGQISSGTLKGNYNEQKDGQKCALPAYTTSCILAKNVTITGSWDTATVQWAKTQKEQSKAFGIGPFYFNSSTSESGSSAYNGSFSKDEKTLTFPDPQIIAFLAAAPPYSPPTNEGSSTTDESKYNEQELMESSNDLDDKVCDMPFEERQRYIADSDVFGTLTVKLKRLAKNIVGHGLLRDSYFDYLGPPYPTPDDMKKAKSISFTSSKSGETTKYSEWKYYFLPGSLMGPRIFLIEAK